MKKGKKGRDDRRSGEWKVHKLAPKAQREVWRFQPFYRTRTGGPHRRHPLWVLDELRNIDKHRRLSVTPLSVTHVQGGLIGAKPGVRILRTESRSKAAKDGAVIHRIWLTPGAKESDARLHGFPTCSLSLDEPSAWNRRIFLLGTMDWLVKQVEMVLLDFIPFQPVAARQFMAAGPFLAV
jgi:hypothetical protein